MKIISRQKNSRMCMICGLDNPFGVRAPFYEMEDGSVGTRFCYRPEHQSYPGRVHGGLITAMLDELGFRAYWVREPAALAVTMTLETKFRKPVPYDTVLLGRGEVLMANTHFVRSRAQLYTEAGALLAEAEIRYIKLPQQDVTTGSYHEEMCYAVPDAAVELEIR